MSDCPLIVRRSIRTGTSPVVLVLFFCNSTFYTRFKQERTDMKLNQAFRLFALTALAVMVAQAGVVQVNVTSHPWNVLNGGMFQAKLVTDGNGDGDFQDAGIDTFDLVQLFCVDTQNHVSVPSTYVGFQEDVSAIGVGPYDVRFENHTNSLTNKQFTTSFLGSTVNPDVRYKAAAWLLTNYVDPGNPTTASWAVNKAIQTAIWQIMDTKDQTPTPVNAYNGGILNTQTDESSYWFNQAVAYMTANTNNTNWSWFSIVSGAAIKSSSAASYSLNDFNQSKQTFIVLHPVPEPGQVAALLFGLGGIGLAIRRRRRLS